MNKNYLFGVPYSYFFSILFGMCLAFYVFPLSFIAGTGLFWENANAEIFYDDLSQALIGARYFIFDSWHFPLLKTKLLGAPDGTVIIFTDSIPLFAIIAKLIWFILPKGFNYIGIWYFLVWTLQPVSAVYALRSIGIKKFFPTLCVILMSTAMPAWWFRGGHAALTGHFLILFSIGNYFHLRGDIQARKSWICSWLTVIFAALVHAYLLLMVLLITIAGVLDGVWDKDSSIKYLAIFRSFFGLIILIALLWMVGYFHGFEARSGFGYYSMNLLSPIVPQISGLFPGRKIIDATGGQYEGYNYLGFGILIILGAALIKIRKWFKQLICNFIFLTIACIAMVLFALSNKIYFGNTLILEVFLREDFGLLQFRSSGRLFWPVSYLILLAGVVLINRFYSSRRGKFILIISIIFQIIDVSAVQQNIINYVRSAEPRNPFVNDLWKHIVTTHNNIIFLPTFYCSLDREWQKNIINLSIITSYYNIPINTASAARRPVSLDCEVEKRNVFERSIGEGDLIIIAPEFKNMISKFPEFSTHCSSFNKGFGGVSAVDMPTINQLNIKQLTSSISTSEALPQGFLCSNNYYEDFSKLKNFN